MSTRTSSLSLVSLSLVSLSLAAAPARAQNGTNGLTLLGSFTVNSPTSVAGTAGGNNGLNGDDGGGGLLAEGTKASIIVLGGSFSGGNGGDGVSDVPINPPVYAGGNGGNGGTGFLAADTNSNITLLGGNFSGGNGGNGGFAPSANGNGGNGGDGFAATGTGTSITVLGGSFSGGYGGGALARNGEGGNAFTTSAGETVSIFGGSFSSLPSQFGPPDAFGNSFFVNGGNVTLYGVFSMADGTSLATPTTFTNTIGTFLGTLANNTSAATYSFDVENGGTLTLAAPVPEASTTVSFGLLLALGLGGVVIAAKRKKLSA